MDEVLQLRQNEVLRLETTQKNMYRFCPRLHFEYGNVTLGDS